MFDLSGRVALVTGAGQHVGAGIAETLAECGATVAVNDVVAERAEAEAQKIEASGARAVAAPFDVTVLDEVRAGVAAIEASVGPVDVLVNNAGIPVDERRTPAQFRDMDPGDWHHYIDINLYGVLNCVKATVDGMCERGFGRIVTISSGAGQQGLGIGMSMYASGKGGAYRLTSARTCSSLSSTTPPASRSPQAFSIRRSACCCRPSSPRRRWRCRP